jgi:hypothetical protein
MSTGRSIGVALFVVSLVACPIALYVGGTRFRHSGPLLAFIALVYVIGCAVVLRSRVIAGAILGVLVCLFFKHPPVNTPRPEVSDIVPLTLAAVVGSLLGQAWHEHHEMREPGSRV